MNDTLIPIKTECYICIEPCLLKSPCSCATHVHPTCLNKYLEISGHTTCTICLGAYPLPPPPPWKKRFPVLNRVVKIIIVICLFFIFGWVGHLVVDLRRIPYEPFSEHSWIAAIVCYFILFILYQCFKK